MKLSNSNSLEQLETRMNQMAISHEESLATLESTLLEQHRAEIEAIERQLRNEMAEVGIETQIRLL